MRICSMDRVLIWAMLVILCFGFWWFVADFTKPIIERVYYASHPLPKPTAWVCDFCYYQWISPPEPPPQCPRCGQKLREVK